jgi:hypothetical protein
MQKWSSVNENLELQAAKMATLFDRKDCLPHKNIEEIWYV